jgi:hypothetical protein
VVGGKIVGGTNVITTKNHRSNNNSKNKSIHLSHLTSACSILFNPQDLENAITQFGLRKGGLAVVRGDGSKATRIECCRADDLG